MGIVGAIAFFVSLGLLVVFRFKLKSVSRGFNRDDPESELLVWASRGCLIVALLGALAFINAHVCKLPNPFDGPKIGNELPDRSPPPSPAVKPDLGPTPRLGQDMKQVRDEHRRQLEEFEYGPKKPEAEVPDPQ